MTLGKKLSNYRKLTGMTQQQLGEHLNLSAQAISKWENDLAEPDLATLRMLAELYKVTIDDLLDLNSGVAGAGTYDAETVAETLNAMKPPIGYCKECGLAVTEENFGEKSPVLLCNSCVEERARRAKIAKMEEERKAKLAKMEEERKAQEEKEARERAAQARRDGVRGRRTKSFIWAGIVAGIILAITIGCVVSSFKVETLIGGLVVATFGFTFTFTMFYECWVMDIMENVGPAAIRWPGLIFTFDLDGFIWLIGMKLLFAVLGFAIGLIGSILAFAAALLVSPFVFVYVVVKLHICIRDSVECELIPVVE